MLCVVNEIEYNIISVVVALLYSTSGFICTLIYLHIETDNQQVGLLIIVEIITIYKSTF